MKRVPFAIFMVALLSAALAVPAAAASPFLDVSHDRGGSAYADHYSCTPNEPHHGDETCEFANAWAFEGWSSFNGERFRGERVCASLGTSVYDNSANTYTDTFRSGCVEDGQVSIAKDLSSASAVATIATESQTCVYDVESDTYTCSDPVADGDVAVDLIWTAISPVSKSTYRSRDEFGDCTNTQSFRGQWVDASVDGTLDSATFDYAQIQLGASRFTYFCHG